jgi:hypothetical protein
MEAESNSETSVNFYQTTLRNNPEGSHLFTRRRDNLKSHSTCKIIIVFIVKFVIIVINVKLHANLPSRHNIKVINIYASSCIPCKVVHYSLINLHYIDTKVKCHLITLNVNNQLYGTSEQIL